MSAIEDFTKWQADLTDPVCEHAAKGSAVYIRKFSDGQTAAWANPTLCEVVTCQTCQSLREDRTLYFEQLEAEHGPVVRSEHLVKHE